VGGWVSIGGVVLDMTAVAGVLAASGGAANPFTALLFVHVALAASMMATRAAILVAAFGALSFGALFLLPESTSCHVSAGSSFEAHLYGMWVAYAVGAALVTLVSTTLRRALSRLGRSR
jgi:two-component system sensor histidine kinase RegB